jgi:hypothetical protein
MTTYNPVVILYEDQAGPRKEFGLHNLVTSMVNDQLGNSFWRLRKEALGDGRPSKGNTKLLKKLADPKELTRMMGGGRPVIAVFDADEPPFTEQELAEYRSTNSLLHIVLLDRNLETIIRAAADCEPELPSSLVTSAVRHKDHNARDRILNQIAIDEHRRDVRRCIGDKVPSLRSLCELVTTLVR